MAFVCCQAVSALIAIGTSHGLVLVFGRVYFPSLLGCIYYIDMCCYLKKKKNHFTIKP